MTHLSGGRVLLLTLALSVASSAQTQYSPDSVPTKPTSSNELAVRKSAVTGEDAQALAMVIISSLVEKSDRFKDLRLRAATQAKIADAIWEVDQRLARELFLKAWNTASTVDQDATQAAADARRTALAGKGGALTMLSPQASMRSEVLKLAARRDSQLGETLLNQLEDSKVTSVASKNTESYDFDPTEPKLAIAKRLEVALQLLNSGHTKQATVFAEPALTYATSQAIIFLSSLRQVEGENADRLYARLLSFTQNDPSADATTVSLLSSYVFTPGLLVTATRRGRVSNQFADSGNRSELPAELRSAFLTVAAAILLRPLPAGSEDRTSAGRAGTYFTIARLLPLFQQYAPNYVSALNSQLTLLATDAPETYRSGAEPMLKFGLQPDRDQPDSIDRILAGLSTTINNAERDSLYVQAIRAGAQKGDPQIRYFADKIEDQTLRDSARAFADLAVIRAASTKKQLQQAVEILRDGQLPPLHRVWAAIRISSLLKQSESSRANQLLEDAVDDLRSIAPEDPQRAYALTCVANAYLRLNRARSWDFLQEAVEAANAVPKTNVETAKLTARLRTKNIIAIINIDEASFSLVNLFEKLSVDDVELALSAANRLSSESSSAAVNLGIARAILNRRKSQTVTLRR